MKQKNDPFGLVLLVTLALTFAIYLYRYIPHAVQSGEGLADDFQAFYKAAHSLFGQNQTPYTIAPSEPYIPYLYPPFFLFLLYPLTFMDYTTGGAIWIISQIALFAWALRAYFREAGEVISCTQACQLTCLSLPFIMSSCLSGQSSLLLSSLLLLGFAWLAKKPYASGATFACAAFKPQLCVLLPFALIAGKHRKAFIAAIISGIALCFLSLAAFGIMIWQDFFTALQLFSAVLIDIPEKFLTQMVGPYAALRMLGIGYIPALVTQLAITLPIAVYIYESFKNRASRPEILYFAALFLVTPYAMLYDMPIICVPLYYLLQHSSQSVLVRIALISGAFMPLVGTQIQHFHIPMLAICTFLIGAALVSIAPKQLSEHS